MKNPTFVGPTRRVKSATIDDKKEKIIIAVRRPNLSEIKPERRTPGKRPIIVPVLKSWTSFSRSQRRLKWIEAVFVVQLFENEYSTGRPFSVQFSDLILKFKNNLKSCAYRNLQEFSGISDFLQFFVCLFFEY